MVFKKILRAMALSLAIVTMVTACGNAEGTVDTTESVTSVTKEENQDSITMNLWYTDDYLTDYLKVGVENYMEDNPNVKIVLKQVAESGYLENINANSIKRTDVVDIYTLPVDDIEKAYLAGLAKEYDASATVYNTKNYCKTAISAITYDNKQVAYPLCFDSAYLVYNKQYTNEAPANFDELQNFANNLVTSEEENAVQLEKVLIWNVADYKMNYQFLSDAFKIGGKNGDDRNSVSVYHADVIKGLYYFQSLNDFFAIDRKTVTEDEVLKFFEEGKAAFAITNTEGLLKLHMAGMDYGVAKMPDMTDSLKTKALSSTLAMVINPYSANIETAQKIVDKFCYDMAADFYVKTGYFPCRSSWEYDSALLDGVYDNYAASVSRTKLMNAGDFYTRIEIMMNKIWDGEAAEELLMDFQTYAKEQFSN